MRFHLYTGTSAWSPHRVAGTDGCHLFVYTYRAGDTFVFTAEAEDAAKNPIAASYTWTIN